MVQQKKPKKNKTEYKTGRKARFFCPIFKNSAELLPKDEIGRKLLPYIALKPRRKHPNRKPAQSGFMEISAMENISAQIQYELTTRKNLSFFREQFYHAEFIEAESLFS
ncbi:hypothetical protein [Maridesulfovibrio ferrireducens]|uniref:hypothetical protein n=1 Tax=Maridesulfovibrio ferrireducens TaxID=246191 RepID=UPI001A1C2775|nr:hypothetical protein [Maridesulfovibrio ferrireducens]MBI9112880.1 hypothetical protein [Maridesulfovibrio ferrireducens]